MIDLIPVARFGRPFGRRGEIYLHLLTDRPAVALPVPSEFTLADGRSVRIAEITRRGTKWTCLIEGGDDDPRGHASRFVNGIIVREAKDLPAREEDEFSEFQIVGCVVKDTEGREIGTISRIEHRYEIDTWVIRMTDGKEGELPAVSEFVVSVSLDDKSVVIRPHGIVA